MTGTSTTTIPIHQLPTSCHVCGTPVPAREGATRPDCWHDLTNAEADAAAAEHDRLSTVRYSNGATSQEAAYVADYIPEAVAR